MQCQKRLLMTQLLFLNEFIYNLRELRNVLIGNKLCGNKAMAGYIVTAGNSPPSRFSWNSCGREYR